MDRSEAYVLVSERIPARNLVNHCVAVECIMGALARHFELSESDIARWELAGLLHDLDYAETAEDPARHALVSAQELAGLVDDEIIHAILGHADKAARDSLMDKALYAADPTTGFIVAAALVRPDRDINEVQLKSLLKRWKESSFARGASRDQMDECTEIGLTREEFLGLSLAAMQAAGSQIGF
jgi:putative nucleotidyltransferase with HDIG domain